MLLVNQGPADLQVSTERHVPAKHKFHFAAVYKKTGASVRLEKIFVEKWPPPPIEFRDRTREGGASVRLAGPPQDGTQRRTYSMHFLGKLQFFGPAVWLRPEVLEPPKP